MRARIITTSSSPISLRGIPAADQLVETFYKGTAKGKINERQPQVFFGQLGQRLLIWGKPDILTAWNNWRAAAGELQEGSCSSSSS